MKTLQITQETVAILVRGEYSKFRKIMSALRIPKEYEKNKIIMLHLEDDEDVIAVEEKKMNELGWKKI